MIREAVLSREYEVSKNVLSNLFLHNNILLFLQGHNPGNDSDYSAGNAAVVEFLCFRCIPEHIVISAKKNLTPWQIYDKV